MPTPASPPWVLEAEDGKAEMGDPFKAGMQLLHTHTAGCPFPTLRQGRGQPSQYPSRCKRMEPANKPTRPPPITSGQDVRLGRRPEPPTWQTHVLKFCSRHGFAAKHSPGGQKQGSQPPQGEAEQSFRPLPVPKDGGKLHGVNSVHIPAEASCSHALESWPRCSQSHLDLPWVHADPLGLGSTVAW